MSKNIFTLFAAALLFSGCVGAGNFELIPSKKPFVDSNNTLLSANISPSKFKSDYFEPWDDVDWREYRGVYGFFANIANEQKWYKENLLTYSPEEIYRLSKDVNASKEIKPTDAISIRNTDLRCVPSKRPLFANPDLAGEGYPFDYAQNSRVYIAMPLKLLRLSVGGDYYFVKSGVGYGWVDAKDIALIDENRKQEFKKADLMAPGADKKNIFDANNGRFVEKLNIGTVLPRINGSVCYPRLNNDGYVSFEPLDMKDGVVLPMKVSNAKISEVAFGIKGGAYGWGGYLDNRDCSMFLRDIFINFGIVLPRNSADQAKGYIDISKFSNNEKMELIKKSAKPWRSIFYMKGHIMLYVGIDKKSGEILAMHDAWGVKSSDIFGNDGRAILGGVVVTTLEEGKGNIWYNDSKSPYIKRILGFKDLF